MASELLTQYHLRSSPRRASARSAKPRSGGGAGARVGSTGRPHLDPADPDLHGRLGRRRGGPRRRDPRPLDRPGLQNRRRRRRIARDLERRRPGRVGLARGFLCLRNGRRLPRLGRTACRRPRGDRRVRLGGRRRSSRQPRRQPVGPSPARAAVGRRLPAARSAPVRLRLGPRGRLGCARLTRGGLVSRPGRQPPAVPHDRRRSDRAAARSRHRRVARTARDRRRYLDGACGRRLRGHGRRPERSAPDPRSGPREQRPPPAPPHEARVPVRAIPSAPPRRGRAEGGQSARRPQRRRRRKPGAAPDEVAEVAHCARASTRCVT